MKSFNLKSKIIQHEKLLDVISNIKKSEKSIAFTNGCFDIIHYGHIYLLSECAEFADVLIIGLNSDSSIKRLKGSTRPVNDENSRLFTLAALGMIDYVTLFQEDTPIELIKTIKPDVLIKGGDWTEDKIVGADFVRSYNGLVKVIPYIQGHSTTETINKLKNS